MSKSLPDNPVKNKTTRFYLADQLPGQFVLVDAVNGKNKPWVKHRRFTELVSESYNRLSFNIPELLKKAQALGDCGSWLKFSECRHGHQEGKKLIGSNFCRQRLCPMCQWRRSLLVAGQVSKVCHEAHKKHKVRFLLLTVTVPNCSADQFKDHVSFLNSSLSKLLNYKQVKKHLYGWFRGFEVTISRATGYHPHYHVLLAVDPSYFTRGYIPQSSTDKKKPGWVQLWQRATKLHHVPLVVDVRAIKEGKGGLGGACAETAKYAAKPGDFIDTEDWTWTDNNVEKLHYGLKGRRSFAYGGKLKEIHHQLYKSDPEDSDADLNDTLERCTCPACGSDLAQRVFRWMHDRQQYISKQSDDKQSFQQRVDDMAQAWRDGKGRR